MQALAEILRLITLGTFLSFLFLLEFAYTLTGFSKPTVFGKDYDSMCNAHSCPYYIPAAFSGRPNGFAQRLSDKDPRVSCRRPHPPPRPTVQLRLFKRATPSVASPTGQNRRSVPPEVRLRVRPQGRRCGSHQHPSSTTGVKMLHKQSNLNEILLSSQTYCIYSTQMGRLVGAGCLGRGARGPWGVSPGASPITAPLSLPFHAQSQGLLRQGLCCASRGLWLLT